jgi:MoaA/NifB/PqqE/SkfB family radical SAM enzyme
MWADAKQLGKKYHFHIELTSKCNASCPHCPRYIRGSSVRNPAVNLYELTLKNVQEWIPIEIIKNIGSMNVCGNFGDPSMCKEMVEIVEYFHKTNPSIQIHIRTNGGAQKPEYWERLGKVSADSASKITTIFSVDGLEDTNHLYRRNVKWDKLITNIKSYIKAGGYSAWEYLIFKHNEHQIDDARKLQKKLGIGYITFKQPIGFEDFLNNRAVPLPVYDKKGNLDYLLEPSTKYKNSDLEYVNNIDEIEKTVPEVLTNACRVAPGRIEYEMYSQIEDLPIKCQAEHENGEIEIYMDSNGTVRPCCHIGVETESYHYLPLGTHAREILSPDHLFNLRTNTLKRILQLFDIRIAGTWNKSHEMGRCIKCSSQCGKSSETGRSRLFADELNPRNSWKPKDENSSNEITPI